MARNRQRARERREARLAEQQQAGAGTPPGDGAADPVADRDEAGGLGPPGIDPVMGADLAASAPPEDAGRSDRTIDAEPPPQFADPDLAPEAAASRGHVTEGGDETTRGRGRVIAFLAASWAELQRVQWPKRPQLVSLTAVVLGFVVLAGGYLGALDAIFSRLIQALL